MKRDDLRVCSLTNEESLRHGHYRYLVYYRSYNYRAFHHRASLERWLADLGLTLDGTLPPEGEYACLNVRESFVEEMMIDLSQDELDAMYGLRTRVLSNGEYVDGVVTIGEDGTRTVWYLNPNVRDRRTYDYKESRRLFG